MGIAPDYITTFNEELGILQQTSNTANPLSFASPDGYQSIEVGRGRTSNDKNYVSVISGPKPTEYLSNNIRVVPNPYIATNAMEQFLSNTALNQRRLISFTNIPAECIIKIFSSSGVYIDDIIVQKPADQGLVHWDLLSREGLEIAAGVYFYHII